MLEELISEIEFDIEDRIWDRERHSSESYDWWSENRTVSEYEERLQLFKLLRESLMSPFLEEKNNASVWNAD